MLLIIGNMNIKCCSFSYFRFNFNFSGQFSHRFFYNIKSKPWTDWIFRGTVKHIKNLVDVFPAESNAVVPYDNISFGIRSVHFNIHERSIGLGVLITYGVWNNITQNYIQLLCRFSFSYWRVLNYIWQYYQYHTHLLYFYL